MERFTSGLCKVVAVLAPLIILPYALAEDNVRMGEDYYGNDINAAILEADQNKRQVNYTNKYWYNRTTSKSFILPKMGAEDLEKENMAGALGVTAAGGQTNIANPDMPDREQANIIQKNNSDAEQQRSQFTIINTPLPDVPTEPYKVVLENLSHTFERGDFVSTQGVYSGSVLTSTPRP